MTGVSIEVFRHRLSRETGAGLFGEIEAACQQRREQRGGHADWARLCQEAGLVNLAFREWQLVLRDEPDNEEASWRLAQHYRERGNLARVTTLLENLSSKQPAQEEYLTLLLEVLVEDGALPRARAVLERAVAAGLPAARATVLAARLAPAEEESPSPSPLTPSDADLVRFAALFAGREDTHARQWARPGGETGYSPVREPLTPAVMRNHLLGTYTVGVYPIRLDGTCTFLAIDLDVSRASLEKACTDRPLAQKLRGSMRSEGLRLLNELRALGLPVLYEDSGYKGRHYWVFLEQPESAEVLHHLGRLLLPRLSAGLAQGLHLEFFPKQAGLRGQGLGNLIKVPLGLHRRTGRRANLLDDAGMPLSDPLAKLRSVQRLRREKLYEIIEQLKANSEAAPSLAAQSPVKEVEEKEPTPSGPVPPEPAPEWTEADFDADPRMRHILKHCPVLAELKKQVDQNRRLSHEEQLVLIHSLGHLPGGPQAVNYLLRRCVDVAPEKLLKSPLRGNPVSCPSIRKKIGHVTRRVACNCTFEEAPGRYPTPVLHLIGMPAAPAAQKSFAPASSGPADLARRFGALTRKRDEIHREWEEMRRSLVSLLRAAPDRAVVCLGGRYRLVEEQGVEELIWEEEATTQGEKNARAGGDGARDAAASGG
jgi:hypothetical protein